MHILLGCKPKYDGNHLKLDWGIIYAENGPTKVCENERRTVGQTVGRFLVIPMDNRPFIMLKLQHFHDQSSLPQFVFLTCWALHFPGRLACVSQLGHFWNDTCTSILSLAQARGSYPDHLTISTSAMIPQVRFREGFAVCSTMC